MRHRYLFCLIAATLLWTLCAQASADTQRADASDGASPSTAPADAAQPRPAPASQQGAETRNTESSPRGSDRDRRIPEVDIGYTEYVLDNGLTLVVHEDHSSPVVAVNIWYHVGSKNEGPAQQGFAHLFEHLMFQGSEHWDGEYFEPFERAGATDMNGTTNTDRTNYFATVPAPALDMALWMESDRMGHFLGAVDEARLEEQLGVVLNEKRQRAGQPYGEVWDLLPPNTYPAGHPYSWSTIGSVDDLTSATLDDVREWFKRYYGPSNATLVLAGDIEPEVALEKVQHYFGGIPAGPPLEHQKRWIAPMTGEHRQVMYDRVPQARVYKIWNVPPTGSEATTGLQIAADLLAGSKTSRLYERLVYDDQIATGVQAALWDKEIGSQFIVIATARPGVSLEKVEAAIDEEMRLLLQNGPAAEALQRSKTSLAASFLRGAESVGGLGGKADILARGEVYHGDPGAYKEQLATLREADAEAIQATAVEWLSDGVYVLSVLPFEKHDTRATEVDRSQLPDFGAAPDLKLPEVQHATLSNGMEIRLAERHEAPIVQLAMVFDAGYAADPENMPGTASLALSMLDEGTETRDALEISADLDALGATLSAGSTLDASLVSLSAISSLLDESLGIYADVIQNPAFPEREFQRLQEQRLAQITQEKTDPNSLAMRTIGPLLYGDDHAYGIPLTGSGTLEAVEAMTVEDMQRFVDGWIRPDNATLVVVGDTTMAELKPMLEQRFGDWQALREPVPEKRLPHLAPADQPRIYLRDRPGSEQATVIAGNVAPPKSSAEDTAMETVNAILGGMFNSRLNLNLREDKHWSYGARSVLLDARAQQPFFAYASVQIDKTAPAMQEMLSEVRGIQNNDPPTASELSAAQANLVRSLPGENETSAELAGTLTESVIFDLPDDYYADYIDRVQALENEALETAADEMLSPGAMTWVVVGDLDKIEAPIRALGWGEVTVLEGNVSDRK